MSLKFKPWKPDASLDQARVTVLEASAGTGKTWQIEALVVRLIAEEGIAISRLLVITFTEAATAELRDKIRRRLTAARDALAGTSAPPHDEVIAKLCQRDQAVRLERIRAALADFDEAPISTIHGFCQRMLTQLAFESGVEPDLELFTDTTTLREMLVADELAKVFAEAEKNDLVLLGSMRWKRAALDAVAKEMTSAVAPRVLPELAAGTPGLARPLDTVSVWRDALAKYRKWFDGAGGQAAVAALKANASADAGRSPKHYSGYTLGKHESAIARLREWLDKGARGDADGETSATEAHSWLTLETLHAKWGAGDTALQAFRALPLFEKTSTLLALRDRLWEAPLVGFATRIRARFEAELRARGLLTFDGMLSQLGERVAQETASGPLATAIRSRYDVALVDEFQDTDAAQWSVLREAFSLAQERRLFLIGDPKQSIYAFRGADLDVYLEAARDAGGQFTLDQNFRSDSPLVEAMNHIWQAGSRPFGEHAGIDYTAVKARHGDDRIAKLPPVERNAGAEVRRAFEVRWFDAETFELEAGTKLTAPAVLAFAAERCALECARLLAAGVVLGGTLPARLPLHAGDIAVLVRTHKQGTAVREALRKRLIPMVGGGRRTLWDSDALRWLCVWLDAVGAPEDERAARAFAVTPLVGWTAARLARVLEPLDDSESTGSASTAEAAAETDAWRQLRASVTRAANRWSRQGFFRAFHSALGERESLPRVLGMPDGERAATDLRHLAELAHLEERRTRLTPRGLSDWLRRQANEPDDEVEHQLRLESDARAVKIVTVHACKGLQYPVTLLPFAGSARVPKDGGHGIRVRLPARSERLDDAAGELCLDLHTTKTDGREVSLRAMREDARGEARRHLYVALTRAEHHVVAWTGSDDAEGHGLNGVLLRKSGKSDVADGAQAVADAESRLDALVARSGGTIGWAREPVVPADVAHAVAGPAPARRLVAQPWRADRELGAGWQVASFSSIVGTKRHSAAASHSVDEGDSPPTDGGASPAALELGDWPAVDSTLAATVAADVLPRGTQAGKWIHSVFENIDFEKCEPRRSGADARDVARLVADLREREGVARALFGAPAGHDAESVLLAALPRWLDTSIGGGDTGLPDAFRLRDLPLARRLDELKFDLSLISGAGPSSPGRIDDAAIRAALTPRRTDRAFPGRAWLEALFERTRADGTTLAPVLPAIAGILTGSIDLLFRASDDGRFFILDYKTNRLTSPPGPDGQRLPSRRGNYTDAWLERAMDGSDYHLQALIYTVALHRLLRDRLGSAYRYDTHVGGHLYLFLRGMEGKETLRQPSGRCLGVYFDRWPADVIEGLDIALAGGSADDVTKHMKSIEAEAGR